MEMFSVPETNLFFLQVTSAMQFKMCPLLITNHLN